MFNGDTAYITQLKQQKIKKVLLLWQHVAIMSTCFYLIPIYKCKKNLRV